MSEHAAYRLSCSAERLYNVSCISRWHLIGTANVRQGPYHHPERPLPHAMALARRARELECGMRDIGVQAPAVETGSMPMRSLPSKPLHTRAAGEAVKYYQRVTILRVPAHLRLTVWSREKTQMALD